MAWVSGRSNWERAHVSANLCESCRDPAGCRVRPSYCCGSVAAAVAYDPLARFLTALNPVYTLNLEQIHRVDGSPKAIPVNPGLLYGPSSSIAKAAASRTTGLGSSAAIGRSAARASVAAK